MTWTRLGETAEAAQDYIVLESPVEWKAGDEIVIATTGDRHSQIQSEVREILAVSGDGLTLTLTGT